jgi:hypothetical protein
VSEQATIEQQGATAQAAPSAVTGQEDHVRRPNRGMQRALRRQGVQNAATRIPQLLSQIGALKRELVEVRQVLALPNPEVEQLRGDLEKMRQELLSVSIEKDALQIREEERIRAADDDQQAAAQIEVEHRTQCLAVLIGAAHAGKLYPKYPDFNTRIKKFDSPVCTRLLTEILHFPQPIVAQMAYVIASNEAALKQLCKLANEIPWACVRWLVKISMEFEGDARVRQIQANLEAWK